MRFHCTTNPDFSLRAPAYGVEIQFRDGYYETEDKQEIRLLHRQSAVEIADSKDELYERAQDLGIEGRSQLSKDELADEVVEEVLDE